MSLQTLRVAFFVFLSCATLLGSTNLLYAEGRAAQVIKKRDKDGDGKISRDEWRKKHSVFEKIDTDKDNFISLFELRVRFGELASEVQTVVPGQNPARLEGQTTSANLGDDKLCAIGRGRKCDIKLAIKRGLF